LAVLALSAISNLTGSLHRQVGRLRAAENAIDIRRGAAKQICKVCSLGQQTAVPDRESDVIDCRQVVSRCGRYYCRAMSGYK